MKSTKVHYIHSLSYSERDKLAGTFVLIALLFVTGLFVSKIDLSKIFDSVVNYQAVMKNAQGITVETAINISGLDVGRVNDIKLGTNNEVNIQFFIYKRFQPLVRADSTGEVSRLSLVGDNIIVIKAGSPDQPMLTENTIIPIKESEYLAISEIAPAVKKMTSMISSLSQVFEAIDPKAIKSSGQDLQIILADIRKISDHISKGKGSVGRILYDEKQEQHVVNSLALIEKTLLGLSQRLEEVQPIIANANQLAVKSQIIVENAVKLSSESQQLLVDVRGTIHKVDQQLNHLPTLINNVTSVLQSAEHTLNGVQPIHILVDNEIWPTSTDSADEDNRLLIKDVGLDE